MGDEVTPGGFGNLHLGRVLANALDAANLVRDTLGLGRQVGLDIRTALDDIAGDVEGVAGSLGDGEAEVEGDAARNGTETNDHTPHLVDSDTADTTALARCTRCKKRLFEAGSHNESDQTSSKLADTLHGEDGSHHSASPLRGSELSGDNGAQRVIWKMT